MSKADVMAGKAYVSIYGKTGDLTKALNSAKRELSDFGSSIMGVGAKVAGMGSAIVGGFTGAIMHFSNMGSALNDMSTRTGISTTALAELGYAADLTGGNMETVEGAIAKMQKNLGEIGPESKKVAAALGEIGLSVEDLSGLAPEDQFQAIAEGIAAMDDPTHQAAAAMALLGGSGKDLLPMIKDIRALRAEAKELGIAPSPESIAAADLLGDTIDKVRKVASAAFFEIGAAVAPMAQDLLNGFLTAVKAVRRFMSENKPLIVTIAKVGAVLAVAGGAIMAIGGAFAAAGMAISGFLSVMSAVAAVGSVAMSVMGAIGAILASVLSPVGLLVAALLGGVYAWARFTESGKTTVSGFVTFFSDTFGGIMTTFRETFGGIIDAIKAGDLSLAGQIAMVGLKLVVAQGLDAIFQLFGDSIGTIAGQVLNGDISGAWSTLGTMVLNTWATVTAGIVNLFTAAANNVMARWQEVVNAISDFILEESAQNSTLSWWLQQASGVDMQSEAARGKQIEQERRAKGMVAQNELVKSDEYQHEGLEAMRQAVQAAGNSANQAMQEIAEGAAQSLEEKTAGGAAGASQRVKDLQQELAVARLAAQRKLDEMNNFGTSGGDRTAGTFGGGMSGSGIGKASAASFSLGALAMSANRGSFEQKQLSETVKMAKFLDTSVKQGWELITKVGNWSMHHP